MKRERMRILKLFENLRKKVEGGEGLRK